MVSCQNHPDVLKTIWIQTSGNLEDAKVQVWRLNDTFPFSILCLLFQNSLKESWPILAMNRRKTPFLTVDYSSMVTHSNANLSVKQRQPLIEREFFREMKKCGTKWTRIRSWSKDRLSLQSNANSSVKWRNLAFNQWPFTNASVNGCQTWLKI